MMMRIMFQSIGAAGSIISYQIGLSSAMVADPAMGGQTTVISRFLLLGATLTCLSLNIHHLWFAAILRSYQSFPVGELPPARDFADLAVLTLTHSLVLSLGMAAPLVAFGILFNVGLALVSRITPTLQLFMVLAPLNLLLGVGLFAALVGTILTGFATEYGDWLNSGWTLPNG
jgi:flagellar biosynthetic protein FliR